MTDVRYELWSRQESGTFERKFPIKGPVTASWDYGMFGRGTFTIPMNDPRLDDFLYIDQANRANDKASILRAYVGETNVADFYIDSIELMFTDTGARTATVQGEGRGGALSRVSVRQVDWDEPTPSVQPDWQWGLNSIISPNAGMEENSSSLQNPGAEEGSTAGWTAGLQNVGPPFYGEPNEFLAIENPTGADTGDWYFRVNADNDAGIYQSFPVVGEEKDPDDSEDTIPGKEYTVTARVFVPTGKTAEMWCTNAASVSTGVLQFGTAVAVITGNSAYQTVTLVFVADQTGSSDLVFKSTSSANYMLIDTITLEGYGIGTDEWYPIGNITTFQASSLISRTGTWSLAWFPNSGIAGNDKPRLYVRTTPGQEVAANVWVYHTEAAAKTFRLTLAIPGVDPNDSNIASVAKSVSPTTWTQIEAQGTATGEEMWFEVRYDETGVPVSNLHLDDAEVTIGRNPATLGVIMNELLDASGVDHAASDRTALAWLTRTWTDTLDSSGAAWDSTIETVVRRGMTFRQVVEDMSRLGYEFSIRPASGDDTDWEFNIYNPGNMGTDHSTADGPAILSRPGVLSAGPFLRREPVATYAMVEGADLEWDEYRNATMETTWGEIETYLSLQEMPFGELGRTAQEIVEGDKGESLVMSFAGHTLTPGVDYDVGDSIRVSVGESINPSAVYRCVDVTVKDDEVEPQFQVEFEPT